MSGALGATELGIIPDRFIVLVAQSRNVYIPCNLAPTDLKFS